MAKKIKMADLDLERRRNHYATILQYVYLDKYNVAQTAIQYFLLRSEFNEQEETRFCESLFYYIDKRYKNYVLEKCVKYLHKQYGGNIYLKV